MLIHHLKQKSMVAVILWWPASVVSPCAIVLKKQCNTYNSCYETQIQNKDTDTKSVKTRSEGEDTTSRHKS